MYVDFFCLFFETFPFRSADRKMSNGSFFPHHFQSLGDWLTRWYFPCSVQSVSYLCHSVLLSFFMGLGVFVRRTSERVRACYFLLPCLCVCPAVSCARVCDWLTEWNVSLISLLLLEGRKGGLCSVISASPRPAAQPLTYLGTHSPRLHGGF